jgi:hypothetical protein
MGLLRMLRRLGQHPGLLLLVAICACIVGLAIPYKIGFPPRLSSREHTIGIATASALVDTPKSQIADFGGTLGNDVTTLAAQASLLGTVMPSAGVKDEIASLARVPVRKLVVNPPAAAGTPPAPAAPAPPAARRSAPRADVIDVSIVQGGDLPIIAVNTQAANSAIAARVANASIEAIQADVYSTAGADRVPAAYRLVVRPLGPAVAGTSTLGISPALGLVGGIVAFLVGCALILGIPALRSAWRKSAQMDEFDVLSVGALPPRHLPRSTEENLESSVLESGDEVASPEIEAKTGSSDTEDILESRL